MPELPEVESLRQSLARSGLRDQPLLSIWRSEYALRTGAFWRDEQLACLNGATSLKFERRGKFLLWRLQLRTGAPGVAVVHLGMTGQFLRKPKHAPRAPHTHCVFEFADKELHFVDPRRFGGIRAGLFSELVKQKPLCDLGPEPLTRTFGPQCWTARVRSSQRAIRDVLLDQSVVAGLGNIYVSETLFVARLHPLTPAHRLRPQTWARLCPAIVEVLERALSNGGTTLRDYRNAQGLKGKNQEQLMVYGRTGKPCVACCRPLVGYVHSGRSGVYCPVCQRQRT